MGKEEERERGSMHAASPRTFARSPTSSKPNSLEQTELSPWLQANAKLHVVRKVQASWKIAQQKNKWNR